MMLHAANTSVRAKMSIDFTQIGANPPMAAPTFRLGAGGRASHCTRWNHYMERLRNGSWRGLPWALIPSIPFIPVVSFLKTFWNRDEGDVKNTVPGLSLISACKRNRFLETKGCANRHLRRKPIKTLVDCLRICNEKRWTQKDGRILGDQEGSLRPSLFQMRAGS